MKKALIVALLFFANPFVFAQGDGARALPSDPKTLVEMAAPFYDYASPDMKPWHVRYRYRTYDQSGQFIAEGQFGYWLVDGQGEQDPRYRA